MKQPIEWESYLLTITGVVLDQISTRLVLTSPYAYETNRYAVWMMERGLWLPIDVLLVSAIIAVPAILMRKWRFGGRWAVLFLPATFGALRFLSGIWNVCQLWIITMLW